MTASAQTRRGPARRALTRFVLLLGLMASLAMPAQAADLVDSRLQIGINLLPAVIAANKAVINSEADAELPIYLVYNTDRHLAERLQTRLAQLGAIRERRLSITALPLDDLLERDIARSSSIFIAEPFVERLPDLIAHAREQRALLFSPFKGDVELGVNAGFRVTDKVLPMVNMPSLKQSKIQLKAFFLRIAVKHEK